MSAIHKILKQYWGYDEFRPLQEDIVSTVMSGTDTLALMPTGGGKSLCFQVPALTQDGLCLVVSPLIALMTDQVSNLKKIGVKAIALHSGMTTREIDYALDRCVHGDIKLLYVSPERIQTDLFIGRFQKMNINLIAVDEAHCISQWGYDFRPAYLNIAKLREIKPKATVLALTATATNEVVDDIQEKLLFQKKHVLRKSFARDNLAYIVIHEENKRNRLLNICRKTGGTGVVYVRNRKKTGEIADFLIRNGISATSYHAGLSGEIRSQRQNDWSENRSKVIVATNAFGMGIDKPDVRFVVHLDLPEDIESYFQEAGRGGRDGKKAWAIILKENSDVLDLEEKVKRKFPEPEVVKKSYRALLNHLQLAAGAGQEETFPVDIPTIAKTFQIPAIDLYNSFRLLENEGYIAFNETFYSPSRLKIIVEPSTLYDFQLRNAALGEFVQLILRSYSGIFDNFAKIDESALARRGKLNRESVIKILNQLQQHQIAEYSPASDMAMVTFTLPAQYDRNLSLTQQVYFQRKQLALEKMESMKSYLSPGVCRQKRLLHYFGEAISKDCGQCDVCLQNKKSADKQQEIKTRILEQLQLNPQDPQEITGKLSQYGRENVLKEITWMVDEQVIYYRPDKALAINTKKADIKS